jgi:hypothetical protein
MAISSAQDNKTLLKYAQLSTNNESFTNQRILLQRLPGGTTEATQP